MNLKKDNLHLQAEVKKKESFYEVPPLNKNNLLIKEAEGGLKGLFLEEVYFCKSSELLLELPKLSLFVKRTIDIFGALSGLILLSPVFALIVLMIKLDSPGPVLYKQKRITKGGEIFWLYKFRSMTVEAEKKYNPVWATMNDSRRTRIGIILRKTSLDELPQLINILKGEMSLVGPRPERPYFAKQFAEKIPRYMDRLRAKAGLTGWAQVNGLRGDTSIVERVKFDNLYIDNWSFFFDFKIIILTVKEVFLSKGAC